jgi:RNA polymerase sigma-70 factor (ECF subfamily)
VEDAQLIEKTLAGDSSAFGELVRKYQDRLYNTLVHITGNSDDAFDVVQDAFVQAFVKLETFQHSSRFYTWLYRIAFNLAITLRRRRKPTVSVEQERDLHGEEPIDTQTGPEQRSERDEERQQVWDAIHRLGDQHRDVIVLRDIEGCSYESISEILEVPVGTIRSRLHRGRAQLRDDLQDLLRDD